MPKKTRITRKPGPVPGCNTSVNNANVIMAISSLKVEIKDQKSVSSKVETEFEEKNTTFVENSEIKGTP